MILIIVQIQTYILIRPKSLKVLPITTEVKLFKFVSRHEVLKLVNQKKKKTKTTIFSARMKSQTLFNRCSYKGSTYDYFISKIHMK